MYSVRCGVRMNCLIPTGVSTYRPCCQFHQYLIETGMTRSIHGCTNSKQRGVRAGIEVKIASNDKILVGASGSLSRPS
jgi:hypothetical protein